MKISISAALSFLFLTFSIVLFVSFMNFYHRIQMVNSCHYATVHEIENSDFSPYVIEQRIAQAEFPTQIIDRSVKEELRIYEVKTSATLQIPLLGYETTYVKESVAR